MIDVMGLNDKTGDFITLEFELLSNGNVQVSMVDRSEINTTEKSVVVALKDLAYIITNMVERDWNYKA